MKILVVTPVYPRPENPPAGGFVHRQVARLVERGATCHVLTYRPAPPPFPRWLLRRTWVRYYWKARNWPRLRDGVSNEDVFYERKWVAGEDTVPAIGEALMRHVEGRPDLHDVDLVYGHWYWTGGAVALRLRERFGWPVAAIARGSEMHEWQDVHPHCRRHVIDVIREADCLLSNCEDLRERADQHVPGSADRIEVVYNGCDAEAFRPAEDRDRARRDVGVAPGSKILLFCGDVCVRKGIPELTEAWRRFSRDRAEWRLVVVGQTTEPEMERILRGAGDRITFMGRLPQEGVRAWLRAADAYVQPSRLEGLANATMEAMAAALPVVTTDTCGQRELIRDGRNGWLVPVEDAAALAGALGEMASDADRARAFGVEARRTILERFDPRKETARLFEILKSTTREAKAESYQSRAV